jgi:hypothetical protein
MLVSAFAHQESQVSFFHPPSELAAIDVVDQLLADKVSFTEATELRVLEMFEGICDLVGRKGAKSSQLFGWRSGSRDLEDRYKFVKGLLMLAQRLGLDAGPVGPHDRTVNDAFGLWAEKVMGQLVEGRVGAYI